MGTILKFAFVGFGLGLTLAMVAMGLFSNTAPPTDQVYVLFPAARLGLEYGDFLYGSTWNSLRFNLLFLGNGAIYALLAGGLGALIRLFDWIDRGGKGSRKRRGVSPLVRSLDIGTRPPQRTLPPSTLTHMQWQEALSAVTTLATSGRTDIHVLDAQYDSRRIHAGDVFVAMKGETADGNSYIQQAIRSGAVAVLTDSQKRFHRLSVDQPELALALVANGRRALAELASELYGHPERRLPLTAVTGTNGKTTTTFLLEQLLQSVDRKTLLIGTIETHIAGRTRPSEHTTPESRDILALFREARTLGVTEAIMEFSSHALAQERVFGLPVDVAVFTNLTQDHLDFHTTMEAYTAAKARLFAGVGAPPPRVAVINQDAPHAADMVHAFTGPTLMTYSAGPYGNHRAEDLHLALGDTRFTFRTPHGSVPIRSPLSGQVNVENLLAAMCAALARGLSLDQIAAATPFLRQVPGRFEVVPGSRQAGFTVIVDYAHTEDALRNLLRLARATVSPREAGGRPAGRVITLFGCGGDRDRTKRPKMGQAAGENSDLVILTSDNPRSEDPQTILDEALAGLEPTGTPFRVEPDRRAAIALALEAANPGDIVLLAGKGHEKVQITATGSLPFDDTAEAATLLAALHSTLIPG